MATAVALTPDTLTANTPTPITPSPASGSHPKTGERRRIQRTLRLDALPAAMLDRVRTQRAAGRSWEQIEHDSIDWPE